MLPSSVVALQLLYSLWSMDGLFGPQVSPAVHERELLGAFARTAEPVRWHTSRGGATITFRTPSAAAGSSHPVKAGIACLHASQADILLRGPDSLMVGWSHVAL